MSRTCVALLSALLLPASAAAQNTLQINIDGNLSLQQIMANIMIFMVKLIPVVAIAAFVVGALMMVLSRGKDDMIEKAKKLLISSVIGMAVVLGSYMIVRTVNWFLFST